MKENEVDNFEKARKLIEHEDKLVDTRISWVLTFNGFLIAGYMASYLVNLGCDDASCHELMNGVIEKLDAIRQTVALAGFSSAMLAMVGISAAFIAIKQFVIDYKEMERLNANQDSQSAYNIIGSKFSSFLGMLIPLLLCDLIAGTWLFLEAPENHRAKVLLFLSLSLPIFSLYFVRDLWLDNRTVSGNGPDKKATKNTKDKSPSA